jgi:cyclase
MPSRPVPAPALDAGLALALALALASTPAPLAFAEVGKPQEVAPGVWFHEGDLVRRGHSNNGWVVLRDQVLVIDANFPSGAADVLPKIRATSPQPIRLAFDTHHHGDHAYGNQTWVAQGAAIVAHEGVLAEMRRHETGFFGGPPGRWEAEAASRPDVRASRLAPPTLLFRDKLVVDDGSMRVELLHLGVAHTRGDGFAWLPRERILFTGDACVNGPYNSVGDASIADWVRTLAAAEALKPRVVCPGHGLMAGPDLLGRQRAFFELLQAEARAFVDAGATPGTAQAALEKVRDKARSSEATRDFVGPFFPAQWEKAWTEAGGQSFPR